MLDRGVSILLGLWLMASIFIWPHTALERMIIGVIISALIIGFGLMSFVEPQVRYANVAMAAILVVTALVMHHAARGTLWHDLILGLALGAVSLRPNRQLVRHDVGVPGGGAVRP